ncbi:hypothetical protein PUNSTDRAFT_145371 [Punctularia strigosozonata HHB-11173 SS5]|uniref:uncharacterized protein n=1 Tax=Punctularia strigosozonata (strain HHB-11173) TaxID=741275 RepID=UPI00044166E9|nr:uncharacterized protein PUNSTDRAFT_145371 [Punctularia strigosozonata HHB-11173 SS5]EIN05974.1 hypothetical protein PUNSTDRAFT_145371 [Punctularia strigosozonata HHB-11173 SS5]
MSVAKMKNTPKGRKLPTNPHYLEFKRTDGSERNWPTNTTKTVDAEGNVNYMRPIPLDESACIGWRCGIGAGVALLMKLPELPEGHEYVLKSWPAGYQMYDHNKGPENRPRHDPYLIGSVHAARFRSIAEFVPHALWLMTDPTLDRTNCQCKYCARKPQREISQGMGLSSARPASQFSSKGGRPKREVAQRPLPSPELYTAVRRRPKAKKVKLLPGPQEVIVPERVNDVYAAYHSKGRRVRRWCREGELVWCALDQPIVLPPVGDRQAQYITLWPAIARESKVKARAEPKEPKAADPEMVAGMDQAASTPASTSRPEKPHTEDEDEDTPWTTVQWDVYRLKLLGCNYEWIVDSARVVPYQAYSVPDTILQALLDITSSQPLPDEAKLAEFSPLLDDDGKPPEFADAAVPYSIALEIASGIARYFGGTDDYECQYTEVVQAPADRRVTQTASAPPAESSLSAVMNASAQHNAAGLAEPSSISALAPTQTQAQAPPLTRAATQQTRTVTQTRFQGLWWGAERIWADDFVRIKCDRSQVAPRGSAHILPPAGPSRSTRERIRRELNMQGVDEEEGMRKYGASGRGVFMRIDGIFMVEIPPAGKDPAQRLCRVFGQLYELVEDDWEEPGSEKATAEGAQRDGAEMGKGKEKEKENDPLPADPAGSKSAGASPSPTERPAITEPNPLPPSPVGYKFRAIVKPGHDVVLAVELIAGRYYPGLLQHPLVQPEVLRSLRNNTPADAQHLWSQEGLASGVHSAMEPWKPSVSRYTMMREAESDARKELFIYWRRLHVERQVAIANSGGTGAAKGDEDVVMADP